MNNIHTTPNTQRQGRVWDKHRKKSEMDYAFLDQKPGMSRRNFKKGRRHAGEERLQRQVSNQGYLIKSCVFDESEKQCGKKRRARLLSDHVSDFNLSVPYSLNRKNRWDLLEDPAEYARTLGNQLCGRENVDVRVSVAESEYVHNHVAGERLKAYYLISGAGGEWLARSSRGASAADLLAKVRDENGASCVNVEYLICKPHPKLFASRLFKGRNGHGSVGALKGTRRAALEVISGNSVGGKQQHMSNGDETPLLPPQHEQTLTAAGAWKSRDTTTYSLADFLKESSPPPVFVKNPAVSVAAERNKRSRRSEESLEHQYNMVVDPSDGVLAVEDDDNDDDCCGATNNNAAENAQRLPHFVNELLAKDNGGTFETHSICTLRLSNIASANDWLAKCEALSEEKALDFRWLNSTKTRFCIDLTKKLLGTNERVQKPLLVLAMGHTPQVFAKKRLQASAKLEVTVNSVFTTALGELKSMLDKQSLCGDGISCIIEAILRMFRKIHENLKTLDGQQQQKNAETDVFNNEFNSHRLAHVVNIASIYQILDADAQKHAAWERQYVGPEELFYGSGIGSDDKSSGNGGDCVVAKVAATTTESAMPKMGKGIVGAQLEEAEEEGFELIDMCEFGYGEALMNIGNGSQADAIVKQTVVETTRCCCESCGEQDAKALAQLQSCGHRFCVACLGAALNGQLEAKRVPLVCLSAECGVEIPMELLRQFVPLPLLNNYVLAHFALEQNMTGVAKCTKCSGLGCVDQTLTFGQVACGQCASVWCIGCMQRPHWPLSCAQANEWSKKFTTQYASLTTSKDLTKSAMEVPEKQQRSIAHQFFTVCSESFARRFDSKQGVMLGKAIARLTDYKTKRLFMELRKMTLHLLEFGNAWLFLSRGSSAKDRPMAWSNLKSMLTELRDRLDSFENEIIFTETASSVDAGKLVEKLKALELIVEKILTKFTASEVRVV